MHHKRMKRTVDGSQMICKHKKHIERCLTHVTAPTGQLAVLHVRALPSLIQACLRGSVVSGQYAGDPTPCTCLDKTISIVGTVLSVEHGMNLSQILSLYMLACFHRPYVCPASLLCISTSYSQACHVSQPHLRCLWTGFGQGRLAPLFCA
jgi:hypothetical protein